MTFRRALAGEGAETISILGETPGPRSLRRVLLQRAQSLFAENHAANRILLVSSLLLLIDSFLPWQHHCVAGACAGTNAWAGPAGFLGALMAISALGLLVYIVASVLGAASALGAREVQVATWLAGGAVVFGLLRFVFALFNHAALFWPRSP